MRGSTSLQLASGLIAALTPLVVVVVVHAVAAAHARTLGVALRWPTGGRWLLALTPVAAAGAVVVSLVLPAPSPTASLIHGLVFVLLAAPAFRALHEVDAASAPARVIDRPVREASLIPRRIADFVPWRWRALPYAMAFAGTATFIARAMAWRHEIMVPSGMALAAVAFLFLYEVWIRNLVAGPILASDNPSARPALIRHVFIAELVLVAVSVASAHALLGVDWTRPGVLTAIVTFVSAMIAVLGCGLALASDQVQRRYARPGRAL